MGGRDGEKKLEALSARNIEDGITSRHYGERRTSLTRGCKVLFISSYYSRDSTRTMGKLVSQRNNLPWQTGVKLSTSQLSVPLSDV